MWRLVPTWEVTRFTRHVGTSARRVVYLSPRIPYTFNSMIDSGVDKRALRILFSSYWSSSGWKEHPDTSPADFAYAKGAGIMFDPLYISHKEAVAWAIRSRDRVSRVQVVDCFLASLTTRRLDLRSALGSFAFSRNLQAHAWNKSSSTTHCCPVCGMYESLDKPEDINVLNFERFKWGGVRHDNPIYIGFDLSEIEKQPTLKPTSQDVQTLVAILNVARAMPKKTRLSDLVKGLASILRSNVPERRTIVGILGYCGILVDPSRADFFDSFPHFYARQDTPWVKDDWPYPVRWWRGAFGVNERAVAYWFPSL